MEVRGLPMPKGATSPFRSIIRGFPLWVAQELAEPLELRCHSLLHPSQRRHTRIRHLTAPGGEALTCLLQRAPLSIGIVQEQIPLQNKAPRDLKLRTKWTGQQCVDLRLLF